MTYKVLDVEDVKAIYARILQGDRGTVIARDFAISQQTVSGIKRGKHWGEITGLREPCAPQEKTAGFAILTKDQVLAIDRALREGTKCAPLSRQYGVCYTTISYIKHGITWAWLTGRPQKKRVNE